MNGFTKLYKSLVTSSIWGEDDGTRIVWITMLALADANGKVDASIPGLAHQARVPISDCEKAIKTLSSPDEYSRTIDGDGRRISKVDGGWCILNYQKYRARQSEILIESVKDKPSKIYFIISGDSVKIGISQNPWARLSALKTAMPHNPELLGYIAGTMNDEKELQKKWNHLKINREWFKATDELLDEINKMIECGSYVVVLPVATVAATSSSSSASDNSSLNKNKERKNDSTHFILPPDLQTWQDIAFKAGLTVGEAQNSYDNFGANGWKRGNGQEIVSWSQIPHLLTYWRNNRQNFAPKKKPTESAYDQVEELRRRGEL